MTTGRSGFENYASLAGIITSPSTRMRQAGSRRAPIAPARPTPFFSPLSQSSSSNPMSIGPYANDAVDDVLDLSRLPILHLDRLLDHPHQPVDCVGRMLPSTSTSPGRSMSTVTPPRHSITPSAIRGSLDTIDTLPVAAISVSISR
jgi:hypothetical protein